MCDGGGGGRISRGSKGMLISAAFLSGGGGDSFGGVSLDGRISKISAESFVSDLGRELVTMAEESGCVRCDKGDAARGNVRGE